MNRKGKALTTLMADIMVTVGRMVLANTPPDIVRLADQKKFEAVPEIRRRLEELGLDYDSYKDLMASYEISRTAKTIVFPVTLAEQFVEMTKAGRIDTSIPFRIPFPQTAIQFDGKIYEEDFFPSTEWTDPKFIEEFSDVLPEKDYVIGMLLSIDKHPETEAQLNTAIAIYHSLAVQRVSWWNATGEFNADIPSVPDNKKRLQGVALATLAYLNAENVLLRHHEAPERVNKKRRKKGKDELKPFYTTIIRKTKREGARDAHGKGGRHQFMYPVRGHFRRYRNGITIWVQPHYRGIEHGEETVKRRSYIVKETKNEQPN